MPDVLIGALAAVIFYVLNPPNTPTHFVAATATAGLDGSAILNDGRQHDSHNYDHDKRTGCLSLSRSC